MIASAGAETAGSPTKMKLARTSVEWVAQVSLLRPGFLLADRSYRNTQVVDAKTTISS
jgi:hypothetical protein